MSREWKPGDAAVICCLDMDCEDATHPGILGRSGDWYLLDRGEYLTSHDARPGHALAVIDPEDCEQVERLADALTNARQGHKFGNAYPGEVANLQAALREFANPTPPKPEEPTGLGAVVEDAAGELWVQTCHDVTNPWSHGSNGGRRQSRGWSEITAVKVLSSGVTP